MTIYKTYPSAVANAIEKALVAALADVIKVPVSFGIVIVLSAVGSTTVKVVSYASAVAPSKMILASVRFNAVAVKDVIVGELIVGLVKVLFVNVSEPVSDTKLSLCKALLNSAKEPVKLLPVPPKSYDLFVNVSVVALPTRVSVALKNVIVLSAVGSVKAKVVS